MQIAETFAERVRARLEELDWTHEDLAKRLSIKAPGVSKIIGQGRNVRIDTLVSWAKALMVSPQWLLGTEGEVPMLSLSQAKLEAIGAILSIDDGDVLGDLLAYMNQLSPLKKSKGAASGE
jgi:transcriptional regulator with XRE-family HTH domain